VRKTMGAWIMLMLTVLFAQAQEPLSEERIQAVKDKVSQLLKDSNSAEFGDIRAQQNPNDVMLVCGSVRAKNSYGGTGRVFFVGEFRGNWFDLQKIGGDAPTAEQVIFRCSGTPAMPSDF